jgi:rhodanese-related sulfurtransferase
MVAPLTTTALAELLASQRVDVVDVRDQNEWEAGHIAGARLVPLDQFRADPDVAIEHGSIIVFVCTKGVRSLTAAKLAERFGYENVFTLEGGMREWGLAGLPIAATERVAA